MNRVINPKKLIIVLAVIEGVVFLIVAAFILPNTRTDPSAWVALGIYLAAMVFSAGLVLFFMRPLLREQAITETGQPAQGRLLRFWDTGTTINDHPLVGMQVEVEAPGLPVYQAETKTVIPRLSVGMLQPGAVVKLMYDLKDPQKVSFVDFDQEAGQEEEPEQPAMAYGEYLQGRVAELEELHKRRMITDADYERRREELGRLSRAASSTVEAAPRL